MFLLEKEGCLIYWTAHSSEKDSFQDAKNNPSLKRRAGVVAPAFP
jgi:hypothetical protein